MEQGQREGRGGASRKSGGAGAEQCLLPLTLGISLPQGRANWSGARRELERATQLEPDNAVAHYQLGRLYKEIHDLDRAKVEFERTAELKSRAAGAQVRAPQIPE